jgi:hypothetical protein
LRTIGVGVCRSLRFDTLITGVPLGIQAGIGLNEQSAVVGN